jgi:hypothetical protein
MKTTALALVAVLLSGACSDTAGPENDNVVITGQVTSVSTGQPMGNVTIRLVRYVFSIAPGGSRQSVFATTTSDVEGQYELSARLDKHDCAGDLRLEASAAQYRQTTNIDPVCSPQSINIQLHPDVIGIRIDPAGGAVPAGSVTSFLATVMHADGTESTMSRFWQVNWSIADRVTDPGTCGSFEERFANPVLFRAPPFSPVDGCSDEGGAIVSVSAWASQMEHRVLITITDP